MAYSGITKPGLHFNTILRNGSYASSGTTAITGVGFAPGLMWEKKRNGTSIHAWLDQVRGNTKQIRSESNAAETTSSQYASIDSDGFTVNNSGDYGTASTLVSWHWKANGAGSVNNDGTTASTVSVNTTAGFSIIKYSGNSSTNSVGHGLGVKPSFFMTKGYNATNGWVGWHKGLTGSSETDRYIYLNSTDAQGATSGYWAGGGGITTSTIGLWSSGGDNNTSGRNYIMYAFAEKKGFSKFGSYIGNGSTDGMFVYTGFKPAWLMYKDASNAGNSWLIHDNKRGNQGSKANPQDLRLLANANNEETDENVDFLSNGFKLRESGTFMNGSGRTYIYLAFAENPLVANVGQSIPATAR
tara:strand:+ start:746 stop:1813 length:1068 start_codon:yes stop_codon:yes gene_type:complete